MRDRVRLTLNGEQDAGDTLLLLEQSKVELHCRKAQSKVESEVDAERSRERLSKIL